MTKRAKGELRLDEESEALRDLADEPASYATRQKNLIAKQSYEPPLKASSEDEKSDLVSLLVTRYARELDTSRDYVTRGQVEDDAWGMRDGLSNKFVEDVAATVIDAMDSGTGTPGSREYRVRAINRHGAAYRWLVLPSHQNRYVTDQEGYRREKTRISDPEPFPQAPSAGAWRRWEAEMASYALWCVKRYWFLPNGEDVLLERFASEVERRLPNRGHGVQPRDVSTRLPGILSNAISVAQRQGSTVVTDLNGTRWVLPLMKPRKRF